LLVLGREYSSEVRFVPDSGSTNIGALSGLAAQFGFAGALGGGGQNPDFYVSLAKSRTVLGAVADTTFRFTRRRSFLFWSDTVEVSGTVAELYDIDRPRNRARERDEAIELLANLVSATASLETGIVSVRTTTDWPALSHAITAMIARELSRYSVSTMQTRAREERRFVDERLVAQRAELSLEEDSLRTFLETNRSFTSSPQLVLEHDRLQRKIALRQQIVVGLAQAYEQSRIEEVRNTPVLTVMQVPEIPAKAARRHLLLKLVAVLLITSAIMVAIAVIQERARTSGTSTTSESDEFARLSEELRVEVERLLPFLRRTDRHTSSEGT
jgi:uncharacterized protein involved in exopolysaccharide biosynthesis